MSVVAGEQLKHSGVEWIGEIPQQWRTTKVRFVARLESGHTPSRSHPEYWVPEECTIPWFSLADVWQIRDDVQEYLGDTAECVSETGLANSAARLLPEGTVVLSRTASVGFSGIMPRPMATTQDFVNWVCGPEVKPLFLLYVFRGMHQEFARLTMGSTHQTIYMPDVRTFTMPLPPISEQERIVDFLQARLPRLDEVIGKKERQIELLDDKRLALITESVTRGLDPNVPMKDSGYAWLGKIPQHWQLKRLKFVSPQVTVGIVITPAKYYVDDGVACLRSLNISPGEISNTDLVYISEESNQLLRKSMIFEDDLVAVRTGKPGTTAVVDSRFDRANCIDLIIVRRSASIDSRFLCYLMNSHSAAAQYAMGSEGALQQHFNIETAKNLVLPLPSRAEQESIADKLDILLERHDLLTQSIRDQIKKLAQYRQALISAAVTGKIAVAKSAA